MGRQKRDSKRESGLAIFVNKLFVDSCDLTTLLNGRPGWLGDGREVGVSLREVSCRKADPDDL
jgi:hypothetical protein